MTRYAREDALSERDLELLLRGAQSLPEPRDFEAVLTINCAAKLGMRAGEIAHLSTDWINWHDRMLEIPHYDNCTQGAGGDVCGYCRNRARDYADTHDSSFEDALEHRWEPKTPAAERSIPFALMSIMGWQDMQTARNYISASSQSAAREVRSKYR